MDDEDSKIRRNLVAACGIVLSLAWLDIPFDTVASRILGEHPKDFVLPPWKAWIAILAVLAYLLVRFRFSVDLENGEQDIEAVRAKTYQILYKRHLKRMATLMQKGKSESVPQLASIASEMSQIYADELEEKGWPRRIEMDLDWDDDGGTASKFSARESGANPIRVGWIWSPVGYRGLDAKSHVFKVEFSKWTQWKIRGLSAARAHLYSRGALAIQWPTILAGFAIAVIFWKLAHALMSP